MTTILVTGATGTLGKPTVERLRTAGHEVRALSRRSGDGLAIGDLLSGAGIDEALAGVQTVVHLSTGRRDVDAARTLLESSRRAGVRHLVLISIVGIERIPLPYYKGKVEIERLTRESGIPFTILRATQFHQFVEAIFSAQRRLPVTVAPTFSFQPIEVTEVAIRLAELAGADAVGRVADIGGPQQRTARELARAWARATGSRKPIWPLTLPGKTFAGYAAGHHMVTGEPYGKRTFEDYLAASFEGHQMRRPMS